MKDIKMSVILRVDEGTDVEKLMSEMACSFEHEKIRKWLVTHYDEFEQKWVGQFEEKENSVFLRLYKGGKDGV